MKGVTRKNLYYFASPYTHSNKFIQNIRYEATIYAASILTSKGYRLLEPIAMCHEQSQRYNLPGGYEFWQDRDRGFIEKCDAIIVLKLRGWKKSVGVQDEIQYARNLGKKVYYIEPKDILPKEVRLALH